jgi:hypothetical protein
MRKVERLGGHTSLSLGEEFVNWVGFVGSGYGSEVVGYW